MINKTALLIVGLLLLCGSSPAQKTPGKAPSPNASQKPNGPPPANAAQTPTAQTPTAKTQNGRDGQYAHQDPTPLIHDYLQSSADTGRLRLALQLGQFYLNKSGSEKTDLDSATLLFTEARTLSLRLNIPSSADQATLLLARVLIEGQDHIGLLRLLPSLSDSNRTTATAYAIDDLWNALHRTPARVDTAMQIARETLRLNETSPKSGDQLTTLLKFAIYHYCNESLFYETPPSPSWTERTVLSGNSDWTSPILDWMEAHLTKDPAMLLYLSHLRQRLGTALRRMDEEELLADIRFIFIKFFGTEAGVNYFQNRLEPAEKEYTLAIAFDRTAPLIDIATYYNAATFFLDHASPQKALRYGLEAISAQEKEKSVRNGSQLTYFLVGRVYNEMKQYPLSLTYFRKAIALTQKQGLVPRADIFKYMTDSWIALGKPQTALAYLQDSLNTVMLQDENYRQRIDEAIGECYFAMQQYDKAETWYLQAFGQQQKPDASHRVTSGFYLGKLYARTGRYEKARLYLQPVVADSGRAFMNIRTLRDAHYELFRTDSATGNYMSAIHHLQAYKEINDSIFDNTRNKTVEDLKLQYQTAQMDRDMLLQQAALGQSRLIRNGLAAGAALLILLLVLVYSRYRTKQKSNRLLQARQEEIDASYTQLQQLNGRLQQLNVRQQGLLEEKEWLMREIHHRVKNNLQIVLSLLNMQTSHLKDELALTAFGDIRSRIRAISLIHQKLYQEDRDMTVIHMPEYIGELIGYLEDGMMVSRRICFRVEVDPIKLDVSQCVPLGLILNEAVTNAIKYAFPAAPAVTAVPTAAAPPATHSPPEIRVQLRETPGNNIHLTISDNGIGLRDDFDIGTSTSMGLQLIRTLAMQLEGQLVLTSSPGLTLNISFGREIHGLPPHPAAVVPIFM